MRGIKHEHLCSLDLAVAGLGVANGPSHPCSLRQIGPSKPLEEPLNKKAGPLRPEPRSVPLQIRCFMRFFCFGFLGLQLLYPGLCLVDVAPGSYKIEEVKRFLNLLVF